MQRYNFFLILANLFSHHRHNHLGTAEELQERLLQSFTTVHSAQLWAQWKITGAMIILLPNREWNQKQKHEKRLYQSSKTIFDGRDAILRVRTK